MLYQSKQVKAGVPALTFDGAGDVLAIVGEFIVPDGLAAGDVIEFGGYPADSVIIGLVLACEGADTGAALLLDAGILSGPYGKLENARTCGAELLSGSDVAQAGGVANAEVANGLLGAPSMEDRGFGLCVSVGAGALVVGAKIRMTLMIAPCPMGVEAV